MVGVLGANHHNFSVTLDDLALVTHGFYGRSDFHFLSPFDFTLIFIAATVNDASVVEVVGAHRHFH